MERTAMVAFYGPQVSEPQLWRIRVRANPGASRVDRIAIAGGEGNAARFFDSYYEPNLPITRLLPLASHIVLMGHRIDSLMVEGLDIATFDSNGFHWFSEDQKTLLREGSAELDAIIQKRLLKSTAEI
jgi:20S proteasome alpha/beta subunit